MGLILTNPNRGLERDGYAGAVLWIERHQDAAMNKVVLLLLLIGTLFGVSTAQPLSSLKQEQHKATFTIIMSNPKTQKTAGCSATALYEHVLLTAAHCDIEGGDLYLNQTSRPFVHPLSVSEKYYDHQDHMLLVVPGVSFKHYVAYDVNKYTPLSDGDRYYMWGNPGLVPDQYREGYVNGHVFPLDNDKDEESIDVVSPFVMLSGPVVGGDSGSAIFRSDGQLAGVLTYGVYYGAFAGVYPLAFTQVQLDQAAGKGTFVYLPDTRSVNNVTVIQADPTNTKEQPKDYSVHILLVCLFVAYKFRSILRMLSKAMRAHVGFVKLSFCYSVRLVRLLVKTLKQI